VTSELTRSGARGAIMIQFAALAFGFFAIAAVVIDVRLAYLAHQQMQTASDFAAIEGLGERDDPNGPVGTFVRTVASESVRRSFDDDLNPANGDPMQYGAGPVMTLSGGQPGSNGSALLTVSPNRVYDPILELNKPNATSGDIVLGSFDPTDTAHQEAGDYTRTDFVAGAAANPGASDALLVRIRRTTNRSGLDEVAGVASAGPAIPFLFGLGSTMHQTPGSVYKNKERGLESLRKLV